MSTLSLSEVKAVVKELLKRYHAEYALLFGSYARGDVKTPLKSEPSSSDSMVFLL